MVDCGGLENRITFKGNVGSNPTSPANGVSPKGRAGGFEPPGVGSSPAAPAS